MTEFLQFATQSLDWAEAKLFAMHPDWTADRPISSNPGSWYISPRLTVIELLVWNTVFWAMAIYVALGPGLKPLGLPSSSPRRPDRSDWIIGVTLCCSLSIIVVYKYITNTIEYMTQPCHLVSFMLAYICFCTDNRRATLLFAIFIHMNVGTLLALGFPDTRDYYRRNVWPHLTVANFFLLHWLIAFAPLYYEWRGTFRFNKGPFAMLVGFIALGILHWTILLPASLICGSNINYMLSPPPGILCLFGKHYRTIQAFLVYPMLALPGLMFPAGVEFVKGFVTGKSSAAAAENPAAAAAAASKSGKAE